MTAATLRAPGARLAGGPRRRTPCEDDPDKWFAEEGSAEVTEAKEGCLACPARLPCLSLAESTGERFGVWGGLEPSERGWGPGGRRAASREPAPPVSLARRRGNPAFPLSQPIN
jgi:hypothetical protein